MLWLWRRKVWRVGERGRGIPVSHRSSASPLAESGPAMNINESQLQV